MKKLIYYSDHHEDSNHTSVESMFGKYLRKYYNIQTIYYGDKDYKIDEFKICVKDKYNFMKNSEIFKEFDFFIIRNDFRLLKNIIKYKKQSKKNFKIGFQPTFLHSYRRVVQSRIENKALIRKYIQYLFATKKENSLLKECDFLLPISKMMDIFLNKYQILSTPLYSCFDFDNEPKKIVKNDDEIVRFIYIGTIDRLREFDKIFTSFDRVKSKNWSFDIYTKNFDYAQNLTSSMKNNKNHIQIHKPIKREKLYNLISNFDIGISLIPIVDLYNVSSPIKLVEYFACQVSTLTTAIPEAVELFCDKNCAFFTQFDTLSITEKLEEIINTKKDKIHKMGNIGYEIIKKNRNYELLATHLHTFLEDLE